MSCNPEVLKELIKTRGELQTLEIKEFEHLLKLNKCFSNEKNNKSDTLSA